MAEGQAKLIDERLITKADIEALKASTKVELDCLQINIELAKRDLTIRTGSMLVVAVGVLIAAMSFVAKLH